MIENKPARLNFEEGRGVLSESTILKMNLTKHITLIIFLCFVNSTSAQCWKSDEVPEGFKINKVYTLDSLVVSENIYEVLDHSIDVVDSFLVNTSETWLFFVISLYSKYDSLNWNMVRLELKQGTNYDVFEFHSYFDQLEHCGAFCYKGFTFYVLSQHKNLFVFKELFIANEQKDFPVYYNKPAISEKWTGIDYPFTEKFIYLFYRYVDGEFKYMATRPSD